MNGLLRLSRLIDALTERVGKAIIWLVLIVTLIGATNAVVRYTFNYSSNAFLEIQWYLFSAIFLLGSGYTLMRNEHVRIDIISGKLSRRAQARIDIFGLVFFLLPMAVAVMVMSWPIFVLAFVNNEQSSNAGGLVVWPVRLLVPMGFLLLVIQALSELIKRIGFLKGLCPDPNERAHKPTAEEELALAIKAQKEDL
ncbi:TRAP transporter small permease subunit [Accumulibacter sp.]|uniref:TRAP transporter small permease subunit n=1 Tax=Accumulibacter sp. TaxID=2053492 RepID=UPI0025E59433|nr:TRAP transporter small permease subunit [Accumulibacter sp.]MCM8596535.1 TRAP transporter small permease subunit [Accumulibacter sp.]MCM8626932.1 TRAP transporter small permease subunit [Accumulibacter sp.]MDS4050683.1 TRAP transporter small permease subunit [Accumulibacter sp.]